MKFYLALQAGVACDSESSFCFSSLISSFGEMSVSFNLIWK